MQDKSIKIGGSLHGVANTGDGSVIQNNLNNAKGKNPAEVIEELLENLFKRYPKASEIQRQTIFQMELQHMMEENPSVKQRLLSAAKSGGLELTKVLANNSFVSVPLEVVRGWIEA